MHEKVGGQTTLIDPTLEKVGGQLTPLTPCFRGLWPIFSSYSSVRYPAMDAAPYWRSVVDLLKINSYVNPVRKNCRDGFNFSERLTTSRNQEEATASSCLNVVTPWVYLHTFSCYCLQNTRNVAKFQENLTLQQFKVIQNHRSWCQWKAHMRLPISH